MPWIKAIVAESRRMTAAGSTYHQPVNRLLYASIQKTFWEKHRATVMRLFGIAEKGSEMSHFDSPLTNRPVDRVNAI